MWWQREGCCVIGLGGTCTNKDKVAVSLALKEELCHQREDCLVIALKKGNAKTKRRLLDPWHLKKEVQKEEKVSGSLVLKKKCTNEENVAASLALKKEAHRQREGCCVIGLEKTSMPMNRRLLCHWHCYATKKGSSCDWGWVMRLLMLVNSLFCKIFYNVWYQYWCVPKNIVKYI